ARVLWYGIGAGAPELDRLAAAVRRAVGVEPTSPFRGHLTLVRPVGRASLALTDAQLARTAPESDVRVDTMHLMRSHLGHGPARYESLAPIRLGGPAVSDPRQLGGPG
ncbi:MAG: hypothetical protein LC721_11420, partial [Actinobacteria bacterium]|nr:hypothetical protein [Actinomycetota bacterium]